MNETLKDWTVNYLKHKDILAKRILSIDDDGDDLLVKERNGDKKILLRPDISGLTVDQNQKTTVVTFSTNENLKSLISIWDSIKDNADLMMIFINPESKTEQKWIIYPRTHARIADDSALKPGLKALFDMVEPLTKSDLKRLK